LIGVPRLFRLAKLRGGTGFVLLALMALTIASLPLIPTIASGATVAPGRNSLTSRQAGLPAGPHQLHGVAPAAAMAPAAPELPLFALNEQGVPSKAAFVTVRGPGSHGGGPVDAG
jgi:hypothetical protein